MPVPTQSEILTGIDNFVTHPSASASLKAAAQAKQKNSTAAINSVLARADANITVGQIGELMAWIRKNWDELTVGERATIRARFSQLRTSGTAQVGVKLFLVQAFRPHADLTLAEIADLDSLKVILDDDPANVDTNEFESLLDQAETVFDMLLP